VLAARVAAGWADERAMSDFEIGGTSGSSTSVLPGLALGGEQRTFAVRGFPEASQQGIRAVTASAEYRAPLVLAARGTRFLPVFLDRTSLSLFADAGSAWCPRELPRSDACGAEDTRRRWLASAGAELNLLGALQYDAPVLLRLGAAAPVLDNAIAPVPRVTGYVTLGLAF
jgi:hypothetical protein